MATIEQLAQQALEELIRQRGEGPAQQFLHHQFPDLSHDETEMLVRSVSSDRELAVERVMKELSDQVREMKVGEADSFLQETFPFLEEEEREDMLGALFSEIPTPPYGPRKRAALASVYLLVDRSLNRLAAEQSEGDTRDFLKRFSGLSTKEIDLLAEPAAAGRHEVVATVVRKLEREVREMNIGEVKGLISEKFPSLGDADQARMIGELTRGIPARQPRKIRGLDV